MRYAVAMSRPSINSLCKITSGLREKPDDRLDGSFAGRYLMRLPDRSLVPADEYEERLRKWREEHETCDQ